MDANVGGCRQCASGNAKTRLGRVFAHGKADKSGRVGGVVGDTVQSVGALVTFQPNSGLGLPSVGPALGAKIQGPLVRVELERLARAGGNRTFEIAHDLIEADMHLAIALTVEPFVEARNSDLTVVALERQDGSFELEITAGCATVAHIEANIVVAELRAGGELLQITEAQHGVGVASLHVRHDINSRVANGHQTKLDAAFPLALEGSGLNQQIFDVVHIQGDLAPRWGGQRETQGKVPSQCLVLFECALDMEVFNLANDDPTERRVHINIQCSAGHRGLDLVEVCLGVDVGALEAVDAIYD